VKSNNPPLSYRRVSTFSLCNLGVGHFCPTVLSGAWTQLHTAWRGRSFLHKKFVSAFGYLAAFSNVGGSKSSDVENDATFRTFDPCAN